MQLEPYLFFYGRCEEALNFYKAIFGGDLNLTRFQDSPMKDQVPPEAGGKIMHADLRGGLISFMASDGPLDKTLDPDAGNISLSLGTSDEAEGTRVFNALAEGGNVGMPLGQAFWGGTFGSVTDRFGTEWMVTIQ